ncbi:DEAD/DEAH box helicase [Jatrophihabitans sp.]|uniref:DEAD/DEAH box helicase n=1 Tax=Jatrophihabitans sp. TaxID=1932789 RepID=UPI002CBB51CD|nr:DEAD/DEAH box helicase [Jatrophihabitans sp.]
MTGRGEDLLHPVLLHHIVNTLGWPSLRPFQAEAVEPVLSGADVLMVAPTAGGKTEAASFPLLSAMVTRDWRGLSVLYVCPLRALLNNLQPRLSGYASWLGRRAELWHGDTGDTARRRILSDPPDLLLTTPESLEAMLVSTRVIPQELFGNLQAIVVDELHAFAGDDRGWHLLAVLERLQRLARRPIQRVGLSATVGNPAELLSWLQGSGRDTRPAAVVHARSAQSPHTGVDVGLDYVGSTENAATVIAGLHRGEKRLAFCESRRQVEELAIALRARSVETYVSHSSLSVDERRRAEEAFAQSRDCVIVSTSTLELGIDVGDLDRVIQIDAPRTVASFLQRLGRTGRRAGSTRNALFLATRTSGLVHAAGLLRLWLSGWVEPVTPPPSPRHLITQQVLALCLQEHQVGTNLWPEWWSGLGAWTDEDARAVVLWLVETGHLDADDGMLFVGPEAERRYGRRHFMELVSVFTSDPELVVFAGNDEIGRIDPIVLLKKEDGPRHLSLAGHAWRVTHIDWRRHRCWVERADQGARMRWTSSPQPMSFELCRARRDVLLGTDPEVWRSQRAVAEFAAIRADSAGRVRHGATAIDSDRWWWTFAGARANATLAAALPAVIEDSAGFDNDRVRIREDLPDTALDAAVASLDPAREPVISVDQNAVRELKFAESLPPEFASLTLAERIIDVAGMRAVVDQPRIRLGEPH